MRGNRLLAGLAAVALLLGGGAAWLVYRLTAPAPGPPPGPAAPAAALPSLPYVPPSASEVLDRAESQRLARLEEQRDRFRSLRAAYEAARPSPDARERLAPALRALWGDAAREAAECRGLVCRVQPLVAGDWRGALAASAAVQAVAERVASDPDGGDPAAFLLLPPPSAPARPADDLLAALEEEIRESDEVRACLAQAASPATGSYEISVDASGITYRAGGDLERETLRCVGDALDGIIGLAQVPAQVKSGARTVALRAPGR